MGTSQDFEVAVEEGATIVRLGSVLFRTGYLAGISRRRDNLHPWPSATHGTARSSTSASPRSSYDDDPEPEPEAELEDRYRERPNVRRLSGRRRRDEIDDIFSEDERAEDARRVCCAR